MPNHENVGYGTGVRQSVEDALRESEDLTRSIVNTAVDGIITIDEKGLITSANPAAQRLFGYSGEELLGHSVSMLMPEPDRSHHDAYIADYLRTGRQKVIGIGREVVGLRKDGTVFPMELSVGESRLGNRIAFTGIIRDITDRKQAEERLARQARELARSNAELERFASVISHDLRSPLVSISGCVGLLAEQCENQPDTAELFNHLRRNVARMGELITSLLAYARLGAGGIRACPFDMEAALAEVLDSLRQLIESAGAVITHDPLPTISADRTLLSQLLQNLIENAIKYRSDAAPRIQIGAERQRGEWLFSVRDNGIGIPPECADKVFQMFQRLHGDLSPYPGSGVGLATCRKIVEQHGGQIWFESTPGEGTTFLFTLADPVNERDVSPASRPIESCKTRT